MKRFVSAILTILMILPLVPSIASAKDSSSVQSGNMDFLKCIGILQSQSVDGTEDLSRMELAKMYYSILTCQDIPEYSSYISPYTDVGEKEFGYVKTVSDMGIMTGVSNDKFGIADTVSYIQLIKTIVSFLGYDAHAGVAGGWPYGYITVANSLGLTENAPADVNVGVTFNAAADVFRLAAEAPLMVRTGFVNETYEKYPGYGYLEYYMGINLKSGIVTSNSTINLDGGLAVDFARVKIGEETMWLSEEALGLYKLIGHSVSAFVSNKSSRAEVVYYELLDNNVYTISADDIISVEKASISYDKNGKEEYIKYDNYSTVVYNGAVVKSYTNETINPFKNKLDGCIVAIDNDNDRVCDVIMVEAYDTFVCGGVYNMVASSEVVSGKLADFSEFGKNTLAVQNVEGDPVNPTDIVQGDTLNCFYDIGGNLTKIVVVIDSGIGVVEEIKNGLSGIESLVIAGKEYRCANSLSSCPDYSKLKPGDKVKYWFNKDYKIGVIQKAEIDFEMALTVDFKENKSLDGGYQIKLFNSNGKFVVYDLSERVEINDKRVDAAKFLDFVGINSQSGKITRQLIRYSLNDDGKLSKIVVADSSKDSNGDYTTDFFVYDDFDGTSSKSYRKELQTFGLKYYVNSKTKIFVIPPESSRDSEKLYTVKNSGYFSNTSYTLKAYGTDKYGSIISAAIHTSSSGTSANLEKSTKLFSISKISQVISKEGDDVIRIDGFYSENSSTAALRSYTVESQEVLNVGKNGSRVDVGDVVVISVDVSDKINKMKLIFDKSEGSLFDMNNPSGSYLVSEQRFVYGDIIYTDGALVTLEVVDADKTIRKESYPISRFKANGVLCETNPRTGNVTHTLKPDDTVIFDRKTYGENCSKALVLLDGAYWVTGIIYND